MKCSHPSRSPSPLVDLNCGAETGLYSKSKYTIEIIEFSQRDHHVKIVIKYNSSFLHKNNTT